MNDSSVGVPVNGPTFEGRLACSAWTLRTKALSMSTDLSWKTNFWVRKGMPGKERECLSTSPRKFPLPQTGVVTKLDHD